MKQLLIKIYLYRIFSEFMLLYPLYNVMFAERGGLSTLQISSLLAIWAITILLCEIPSGALADKYPRRIVLGLAQVIRAIGYSIWVFFPTYEGFLTGLALWGVGRSMTSGAFEALVFEELKSSDQDERYAAVIGRSESLALFFSFGSTLLAAPVFMWLGYDGVLWASVSATIIASLIAFSLPQPTHKQTTESPSYSLIVRQAITEIKHNYHLVKLIIFGIFVGMLFRVFDEYASLVLKDALIPTEFIPLISTLVFLPTVLAGFAAYRLEKLRQISFMILLVIAGFMLMLAGQLIKPVGIIGFAAFMLLIKIASIVFNAKVQHAITGQTRATITSFTNFGIEITAVAGFLGYGLLASIGGTNLALIGFGSLVMFVGIGYLLVTRGHLIRKHR